MLTPTSNELQPRKDCANKRGESIPSVNRTQIPLRGLCAGYLGRCHQESGARIGTHCRTTIVCGLLFLAVGVSHTAGAEQMSIEQIIRQHGKEPVAQSIGPVASALANRSLLVATDPGAPPGKLRLRTAVDNQGNVWAYAYTNAAELSKAFPNGASYVELTFPVFFGIIEANPQFRGIYLNSASDSLYPIPRELFQAVKALLPGSH